MAVKMLRSYGQLRKGCEFHLRDDVERHLVAIGVAEVAARQEIIPTPKAKTKHKRKRELLPPGDRA